LNQVSVVRQWKRTNASSVRVTSMSIRLRRSIPAAWVWP